MHKKCRTSNKCCNNYYLSLWRAILPHIPRFSSTWHFPRHLHIRKKKFHLIATFESMFPINIEETLSGRHVLCPLPLFTFHIWMKCVEVATAIFSPFQWKANENKLFLSTSQVSAAQSAIFNFNVISLFISLHRTSNCVSVSSPFIYFLIHFDNNDLECLPVEFNFELMFYDTVRILSTNVFSIHIHTHAIGIFVKWNLNRVKEKRCRFQSTWIAYFGMKSNCLNELRMFISDYEQLQIRKKRERQKKNGIVLMRMSRQTFVSLAQFGTI